MALIRILLLLLIYCAPADGAIRFRKILLRGNPEPYSPMAIPNLFGWWKADALTNLVNGSEIVNWPDSSGHNLTMLPSAMGSAVTPYWTNNFQNSKPAAYFDGVNDYMTNACGMEQTNLIFFVVSQRIPDGTFSYLYEAISNHFDYLSYQTFRWNPPQYHTNSAYAGAGVEGKGPETNTITTVVVQYAAEQGAVWTNGVLVATNNISGGSMASGMIVGCKKDFTMPFRGYLLEMFCATNVFATPAILNGTTAYFRNKYAHH